jgi:hypothetical protein
LESSVKISPVDRDARAIEIAKAESPGRAAQIASKLKTESWREVAEFASYVCQHRALQTRPWELAPIDVDEDDPIPGGDDAHRKGRAITLLRRLLHAGLSRYEPQPLAAIAKMESLDRVT